MFLLHVYHECGSAKPRMLETWKRQCFLVECQRQGTASSRAECCDNGIGERALPFLERDHGRENLLLVLGNEDIGLQDSFDRTGDFSGR